MLDVRGRDCGTCMVRAYMQVTLTPGQGPWFSVGFRGLGLFSNSFGRFPWAPGRLPDPPGPIALQKVNRCMIDVACRPLLHTSHEHVSGHAAINTSCHQLSRGQHALAQRKSNTQHGQAMN